MGRKHSISSEDKRIHGTFVAHKTDRKFCQFRVKVEEIISDMEGSARSFWYLSFVIEYASLPIVYQTVNLHFASYHSISSKDERSYGAFVAYETDLRFFDFE